MKFLKFLFLGVFFGIIMAKSEAMSWFRIQEMFRFQSFHMYGIIGTAVVLGAMGVALIKRFKVKDINGNVIHYADKEPGVVKGLVGGSLFGMGWAITGACPGPIMVNLGYGYWPFAVVFVSAVLGTYVYGLLRDKLPH